MNNKNFMNEIGIDRRGVKKGSLLVPSLALLVLAGGLLAREIEKEIDLPRPRLELKNFVDKKALDDAMGGTKPEGDLFIIARVKDQKDQDLYFQIFDGNKTQVARQSGAEAIAHAKNDPVKKELREESLAKLKSLLKGHWRVDEFSLLYQADIFTYAGEINGYEMSGSKLLGLLFDGLKVFILRECPHLLTEQLTTGWWLILYSLVPGVLGLIYRRAFWAWFLTAFLVLSAIKMGYAASDEQVTLYSKELFLSLEWLCIVLLLVSRLRRHSVAAISARAKWTAVLMAVTLFLSAIGIGVWVRKTLIDNPIQFWLLQGVVVLLVLAIVILRQSFSNRAGRPKNIVVCLDGTWNQPGQRDFGYLAETNVYKLFKMLKGDPPRHRYNASRGKEYLDEKQCPKQIAFYYNGVGNRVENSKIGEILGGGFGLGAGAIVERAYLDVVRV